MRAVVGVCLGDLSEIAVPSLERQRVGDSVTIQKDEEAGAFIKAEVLYGVAWQIRKFSDCRYVGVGSKDVEAIPVEFGDLRHREDATSLMGDEAPQARVDSVVRREFEPRYEPKRSNKSGDGDPNTDFPAPHPRGAGVRMTTPLSHESGGFTARLNDMGSSRATRDTGTPFSPPPRPGALTVITR